MPSRPYQNHLRSSGDLVTSYEARRAGFVAFALEKNRRSTPYVAEARALQEAASQARTPADLLTIEGIEAGLLTAAGLSDKALVHLLPEDKVEAIKGLIKNFLEPAGEKFVEELVFRFLLTVATRLAVRYRCGDREENGKRDMGAIGKWIAYQRRQFECSESSCINLSLVMHAVNTAGCPNKCLQPTASLTGRAEACALQTQLMGRQFSRQNKVSPGFAR